MARENRDKPLAVVALGGNAILQPGQKGTAAEQLANVQATAKSIVELIKEGYDIVITHGNGPQVGAILLQNEEAASVVPPMPMDICGAETQGQIGYMIQQSLGNELVKAGIKRDVVTVVTQVVVSEEDPAFANPTKPVGPFYGEGEAKKLMAERGWVMKEDAGRGWRRVVPSPNPLKIKEKNTIVELVKNGTIVIASGGGGIPVLEKESGETVGVEAVIDKDLAGECLARDVEADILLILTDVNYVALNYGTPEQKSLTRVTLETMRRYQKEGHFKAGSMGPKVEALVRFVENGGERAIIASLASAPAALRGETGTEVVKAG
ncbi:MAG TPA: carbamate kinase [Firmicutes bacterium]|nr:carbamate kinase [Bacillota bacterium]